MDKEGIMPDNERKTPSYCHSCWSHQQTDQSYYEIKFTLFQILTSFSGNRKHDMDRLMNTDHHQVNRLHVQKLTGSLFACFADAINTFKRLNQRKAFKKYDGRGLPRYICIINTGMVVSEPGHIHKVGVMHMKLHFK